MKQLLIKELQMVVANVLAVSLDLDIDFLVEQGIVNINICLSTYQFY